MDHIAEQEHLAITRSENDMDEDTASSEDDKKQLIEYLGDTIGEAYLQKETRKSRVRALVELAQ